MIRKAKLLLLLLVGLVSLVHAQTPQHGIFMQWDYLNPSQYAFNIYRYTGTCAAAGFPTTPATPGWILLSAGNLGITSFLDPSVVVGVVYCWYVTAVQGGVESSPSNTTQNVMPLVPVVGGPPPPPVGMTSVAQ